MVLPQILRNLGQESSVGYLFQASHFTGEERDFPETNVDRLSKIIVN